MAAGATTSPDIPAGLQTGVISAAVAEPPAPDAAAVIAGTRAGLSPLLTGAARVLDAADHALRLGAGKHGAGDMMGARGRSAARGGGRLRRPVRCRAARPRAFDEANPDQALLAEALRREAWRDAFRPRLAAEGAASVMAGEADAMLSAGWSLPEPWGAWAIGPDAVLDLPLPEGRWRVELDVRAFPPAARPRMAVTQHVALLAEARRAAEDALAFVVEAGADGARIALALPDATSRAASRARRGSARAPARPRRGRHRAGWAGARALAGGRRFR